MVASGAADPRRRHGPKKGPANKAGPRGSSCVRVAVWVESPSPRTRPQIACVELVPWSVRSRTPTVRCQRKCRAVLGGAARQSQEITHLLRNSPEPTSSLWGEEESRTGQGRLENGTVTVKSRTARANPHNLLRLLRRLAGSIRELECDDSGTPEKGPANNAGPRQGRHVRGLLPAPRARPQIAYVELVPWSVRSRTATAQKSSILWPAKAGKAKRRTPGLA
jgi:hypothetical protein